MPSGESVDERFRLGKRVARRTAASKLAAARHIRACKPIIRVCGATPAVPTWLARTSPWDALGTRLIQRAPRSTDGCPSTSLLDLQSAHHPGIKHERAARFKSSVSYNSSTLKHDSQEQLCSKGATPLQRHHSTTDATASANDASHPHARSPRKRQDPPEVKAAAAPHYCTRRRRRAAALPRVLRAADRKWRRPRRLPVVAVAAGAGASAVPRDTLSPELGINLNDAVLTNKGD